MVYDLRKFHFNFREIEKVRFPEKTSWKIDQVTLNNAELRIIRIVTSAEAWDETLPIQVWLLWLPVG